MSYTKQAARLGERQKAFYLILLKVMGEGDTLMNLSAF